MDNASTVERPNDKGDRVSCIHIFYLKRDSITNDVKITNYGGVIVPGKIKIQRETPFGRIMVTYGYANPEIGFVLR